MRSLLARFGHDLPELYSARMSAQEIHDRFRGVENSPPATEEQLTAVKGIRSAVLDAALAIDAAPLHPRYKATALTDLESAGMFAVKGVFQPYEPPPGR